jgi:hypothetical protein
MELLGDVGPVEIHFGPFREGVSIGARKVHGLRKMYQSLELSLDTPDGTPRRRGSSENSSQFVPRWF